MARDGSRVMVLRIYLYEAGDADQRGEKQSSSPLLVPLRAQAAMQQKEEAQCQQPADQSPAGRQAAAQYLKESSKRSQSHAFYTWSWSLGKHWNSPCVFPG